MISLSAISKVYGKKDTAFTALSDISFEVPAGSTLAVIGKSGSGKSTLMHIMSGLDRPTSGTIKIDDVELFNMKPKAMDAFRAGTMSFIFQAFFVEANQSCYQNVMLPLEIGQVPRRKRKSLVMNALKAVELDDKAGVLAGNLSGGQKQRLAIARAIVNQPKILFADEPTGNLDSTTGEKIMQLLFNLNKDLGCTLVLVTHDHELAARCQHQITIKDGHIESIVDRRAARKAQA
ncbi:ABC transporter ATP-binding protein [Candidatus Saccharibacteria bacterium]|nr:ABC transporter ATP-binding protein [Candidatus Saccharibacteria bacterium]